MCLFLLFIGSLLTFRAVQMISAPLSKDGVESMMASLESFRGHTEQNARLIDKQTLDEEVQEINQGQPGFYLYPRTTADLVTIQLS